MSCQQWRDAPEVSLTPSSSASGSVTLVTGAPTVTHQQQRAVPEEAFTPSSSASVVTDKLSLTMLAQQFPPLPTFTGDAHGDKEEEEVKEWLERLEMMATACGWSELIKLVNLVTRLRGSVYSFYRSCTLRQQSFYQRR